ncbi:MAG: Asp-tRNA(Asn)/Glu-tRNA(Gln) amidotransferase GatCAB subunit A, partial [Burkholderiales bacterium]|nr:Asp-tRNA(Asn)/Glu-tRNA(Gln) amidotransferase GatCAB subunit A [Burkholderiales bacterium]
MSFSELTNQTVEALSTGLHERAFSATELAQAFLAKIDALQPTLNAFVSVDHEGALAVAAQADEVLQKGGGGDLTGIPIAQKDLFMTKGLKTTCSSKMLANYIAPYDAHIVERLKKAGTVLLGKTAMDEFAMGSSTETSYFGVVRNPWNT